MEEAILWMNAGLFLLALGYLVLVVLGLLGYERYGDWALYIGFALILPLIKWCERRMYKDARLNLESVERQGNGTHQEAE